MSTWLSIPFEEIIIDLLKRRGGVVKVDELYAMLKAILGDVSQREVLKALLKLELHDVVKVTALRKNVKTVTLVKTSEEVWWKWG